MARNEIRNLTLAAMFLAIGYILPFLVMQMPPMAMMFLPMHLPVFLCGLICGWKYGGAVGFVLPITRSAIFGMPAMFPMAISMSFELAVYGLVVGIVFELVRKQNLFSLYLSIIIAMVAGRITWGLAMWVLLTFGEGAFSLQWFITGALVNAWPGIVLQLVLIPTVMIILNRVGLVNFRKNSATAQA
ncbi:MAG: ECF transporter S component [Oscillospiraceae bacterium]|nr:ECF transporter S component [Oscillospiraceae bacterium]